MDKPTALSTQACFKVVGQLEPSYIKLGLPLPQSSAYSAQQLCLVNQADAPFENAILTPVTYWADGSVKWLSVEGVFKGGEKVFIKPVEAPPTVSEASNQAIEITGQNSLQIDALSIELSVTATMLVNSEPRTFIGSLTSQQHTLTTVSDYRAIVLTDPQFENIELECAVRFCLLTKEAFVEVAVRNLNASTHPNGTWDLGDSKNLLIQNLSFEAAVKKSDGATLWINNESIQSIKADTDNSLVLSQTASGGENFQSPVHLTRDNKVEIDKQGYEVLDQDSKAIAHGLRAEPVVVFQQDSTYLQVEPVNFWQNFPATLSVTHNIAAIGLFPIETELQAGESKTWQLRLSSTASNTVPVVEKTKAVLNPAYLNETNALPLSLLTPSSPLQPLVDKGVNSERNFFNKREVCDEFGWRNFGELYADHEAIGQPESPTFISHYNNQYDPIYGSLIQFLSTSNPDWAAIAEPLAQHVMDIDIYNTQLDKPEYNGGLFWHTDHYLPAATCTHRTYSVFHESVYDGHQGGGGPGGQHCYTSGLALYSLVYGDPRAKEKVLQLTNWIRRFYNGDGSLLSRLHRFVSVDLKPNQLTNIGIVQNGYRYPLDRGIGNYINALCDSFELTGDADLLTEIDFVIRNTVGLADNLDERQLDNVENSWFYVVFLASTAKYLLMKEQLNQNDAAYAYARAAFLKYADWMLANEQPYLTNPDELEFPNDTWAAQDIRKANILHFAAYFSPDKADAFIQRGEFFLDYVTSKLADSAEAETTRILAILMQNYGVIEKLQGQHSPFTPINLMDDDLNSQGLSPAKRLLQDAPKMLRTFSLKKEIAWVKNRLPSKSPEQKAPS